MTKPSGDERPRDAVTEEATVRAFVARERRDRWLTLLANPRRRQDLLGALDHGDVLDARFARLLESSASALDTLRRLGAPADTYLLSSAPFLDRRRLPLDDALFEVERSGCGTLLCCVPGRLALLVQEGDVPTPRWLLRR